MRTCLRFARNAPSAPVKASSLCGLLRKRAAPTLRADLFACEQSAWARCGTCLPLKQLTATTILARRIALVFRDIRFRRVGNITQRNSGRIFFIYHRHVAWRGGSRGWSGWCAGGCSSRRRGRYRWSCIGDFRRWCWFIRATNDKSSSRERDDFNKLTACGHGDSCSVNA
jgi:hypothetical protein